MVVTLPRCPTCGQRMGLGPTVEVLRELSPNEALIFLCIMQAGVAGVTVEDLIDGTYGDDPEGGPLSARKVIHVLKHRLAAKALKHGFRIHNVSGRRYVLVEESHAAHG